jgi:MFS family permease
MTEPAVSPEAPTRAGHILRSVVPGAAMIAVTFGVARYGYGLLLPQIQSDLGITPPSPGLIASAAYASYLVANVGVIWMTVRLGPRWPIGLAAVLAAAGMAAIATAGTSVGVAVGAFRRGGCRRSGVPSVHRTSSLSWFHRLGARLRGRHSLSACLISLAVKAGRFRRGRPRSQGRSAMAPLSPL